MAPPVILEVALPPVARRNLRHDLIHPAPVHIGFAKFPINDPYADILRHSGSRTAKFPPNKLYTPG
jgi:hypothetical protein